MAGRLTHLDARGRARMVDVGSKPETERPSLPSVEASTTRGELSSLVTAPLALPLFCSK